jgi:hypothetical protein
MVHLAVVVTGMMKVETHGTAGEIIVVSDICVVGYVVAYNLFLY